MSREQSAAGRTGDDASRQPAARDTRLAAATPVPQWDIWQIVLVASVLLLAFASGGWLVDWTVRRRHGGFRL